MAFAYFISSYANRGNVAIIVWNTLEAPYVWDVSQTEYEGTINLGNSDRSLLSIYFRDYVFTAKNANNQITGYPLKEVEYMTVSAVPSTDGDLGENQIKLTPEDEYANGLMTAFDERAPRGTDAEEWTTVEDKSDTKSVITAYAPAFDNLDSFYGKVVTVIFGKDNEVVSIRIVDDTVNDEYLTAFDKDKLTIGEKTYKFADDAKVYVNTEEITVTGHSCGNNAHSTNDQHDDNCGYVKAVDAEEAMAEIGDTLDGANNDWDWSKDFNKVIKSNVTLNNKGKVTRLDLFVSGDYDLFKTREAVVSKVRNEVISLKSADADIDEIDYSEGGDYEDEDDQPRVMKDNKLIKLEDITVGDVLTCYYKEVNNKKVIKTIYVSSAKKDGELTRVSKTDLRMTVDGEKYYASMGESTKKFLYTDDKMTDAKTFTGDVASYIGEDVTLYLNVYGEYVLMASDKENNDWTFGVVTSVRDTEDDAEDDDIYRIPVRILLADGTTARNYKFIFDDGEDKGTVDTWEKEVGNLKNNLVVFSADANGEIAVGDYDVVAMQDDNPIAGGDYETKLVRKANATIDDNREMIDKKVFASSTVIFNLGKDQNGDFDPSVSKRWKDLIDNGSSLHQDALLIYEDNSKTLSYVLIVNDDYGTTKAQYAIVETDDYKEKNGSTTKKYVDLLLANATDAETFETDTLDGTYAVDMERMFVEYQLSGSKLEKVTKLIDLPEFKKLKSTEEVKINVAANANGETKLVVKLFNAGFNEVNATHGTITCPKASDKTATTCDCTGFVAHEDAVDAVHGTVTCGAVSGGNGHIANCSNAAGSLTATPCAGTATCPKASDKTAETCTCTGFKAYKAEKDAVHGTVACPKANDKTAETCTCTNFKAHKAPTEKGTIKSNFKVVDTQKLLLEYEDDEDEVERSFKDVKVDEDVVVYDARDGKLTETTFKALQDEVKEEGYVYVIPFANRDADGYYSAQGVEETDVTNIDANILVIVK